MTVDSPRWTSLRLHDRWSTLLLRFGFEKGVSACLGALGLAGRQVRALVVAAPDEVRSEWRSVASRSVPDPEDVLERIRPFLERLVSAKYPYKLALKDAPSLLVPIRDGERFFGVLALWTLWGRKLSAVDHPYLADLASLLGKAWGREHHIGIVESALRLSGTGNLLGQMLERDDADPLRFTGEALLQLRRIVPFSASSVWGMDWEKFQVKLLLAGEDVPFDLYEEESFLLGRGLRALAMEQDRVIVFSDLKGNRFRGYAAVPARGGDDAFRLVGTFGAAEAHVFTGRRVDYLRTFMNRLAGTWSLWSRMQRWKQEALFDEITGLRNKRCCLREFEASWERHRLRGGEYALAFFDLDHFKTVNDMHGHVAGDVVLGRFGEILRRHAEQMGMPCRFGGEEFLLLMPGTSLKDAVVTCEKIRKTLASEAWNTQFGRLQVTVSCGISEAVRDCVPESQNLLALADARLYAAKGRGRNRIVFSD